MEGRSLFLGGREETFFLITRRTIYNNLSQDEFTEMFW